jgi:hypothetical protein
MKVDGQVENPDVPTQRRKASTARTWITRAFPADNVRNVPPAPRNPATLSYLGLRRGIGVLAFALPVVVWVGAGLIDHRWRLEPSISDYYYTSMRDYFVGTLFAIGVFLFSYRYDTADDRISTVAALAAFGVALFPTGQHDAGKTSGTEHWVSHVHFGCAAALFLLLAYFSLFLFTRTGPQDVDGDSRTKGKRRRDMIYRACGVIMLVAIVLGATNAVSLFLAEALAIYAFAFSWLVKGGFIGTG